VRRTSGRDRIVMPPALQVAGACADSVRMSMSPDAPMPIVDATLAAVHRRDHAHSGDCCHPHVVEIVNLGRSAVAVCHDCGFTYGFESEHECRDAAQAHRLATAEV
jgi:hypothetical protein